MEEVNSQSINQPSSHITQPHKSHWYAKPSLWIAIAIVVFSYLVFFVIYLLQQMQYRSHIADLENQLKKQNVEIKFSKSTQKTERLTTTPTTSTSKNNQKSFTSKNLGIAFNYPSDWIYSFPPSAPEIVQFSPQSGLSSQDAYAIEVSISNNPDLTKSTLNKKYGSQNAQVVTTPSGLQGAEYLGTASGYNQQGGSFVIYKDTKAVEIDYVGDVGGTYWKVAGQILDSLVFN